MTFFSLPRCNSSLFSSDVDNCVNHACANGATCVDGNNNYSCSCLSGFTGERCETGKVLQRL